MAQITYENKVKINDSSLPAVNKVRDVDMNEIKSVINENYAEQEQLAIKIIPNIIINTEVKLNYTYGGKDVYFKRVSIGSFPNATTKSVNTEITDASLVKSYIYMDDGASLILLPYVSPMSALINSVNGNVEKDCTTISLTAGTDRSNLSGFADIYYTKI